MADEQGAIPEALERLFDQAFADGIAAGKSYDESILAGSSGVYARSALTIFAADRLADTGERKPYLSDRFEWAAPGDRQEDAWIVRFCDQDVRDAIYTGPDAEAEARTAWERHAPGYNMFLFRLARLATPKPPVDAGDMRERCARVADEQAGNDPRHLNLPDGELSTQWVNGWNQCAEYIAAAIRNLPDAGEGM